MSKLGGFTAFAAEAALWVGGAALIASAAGMHWNFDPSTVDLGKIMGTAPSPSAPAGPSASATWSLAPGASPTISPVVPKYLAIVARPDFQFRAKYTNSATFTLSGTAYNDGQSGTMSYRAGDTTDTRRETINGAVTTHDYVYIGGTQYESTNSAAWVKSARPATDIASNKLLFTPSMAFVDKGVETKNGAEFHRLEVADPVAFSTAMVKATDGATDGQLNYTVWVADDGTPADFKVEGWMQLPVGGISTKATSVNEFRIIGTSVATITAPI